MFQRLEWMTYDWRTRLAVNWPKPYATNLLAGVFITDQDLKEMNDGAYGYQDKFPWPTHYYGMVVRELARQGATVVGTATTPEGAEKITAMFAQAGLKGHSFALNVNTDLSYFQKLLGKENNSTSSVGKGGNGAENSEPDIATIKKVLSLTWTFLTAVVLSPSGLAAVIRTSCSPGVV